MKNIIIIILFPIFCFAQKKITINAASFDSTSMENRIDLRMKYTDTIALSNRINLKEPTIVAGTTSQYWRGDKTWQTLNAGSVGLANVTNDLQLKAASNLSDVVNVVASRTNLGGTTIGVSMFTLNNPSAVTFPRFNADNTITAISANLLKTDLGLDYVDNTSDLLKPLSDDAVFALYQKQAQLLSGVNIKTINSISLLGSGDITIAGGGAIGDSLQIGDYLLSSQSTGFRIEETGLSDSTLDLTKLKLVNAPQDLKLNGGSYSKLWWYTTGAVPRFYITSSSTETVLDNVGNTPIKFKVNAGTIASAITPSKVQHYVPLIIAAGDDDPIAKLDIRNPDAGISFYADNTKSSGNKYGLILNCSGAGDNKALYLTAYGGSTNYGLYIADGTTYLQQTGIGNTTPDPSALLDITSLSQGFLPPRLTNVQMTAVSSPAEGLQLYNITSSMNLTYDGANFRSTGIRSASYTYEATAQTTFTVTFGGTQQNSTYKVNVTPSNALSASLLYVNNKTTTTFDVVYLSGLTGTVAFDYSLTQ